MTNPFTQAEVPTENSYAQFNAFESAAPSALKEFPALMNETRSTTSDSLTQYDSTESQPFEITDGGQVLASSCPTGGCPCCEYTVRGWNRNAAIARNSYSSSDDGSYDDGEDYEPDGGDCDPGDDGGCGPGGGPLSGLLGRFGRGGLFGRLFGGGGLGLARAFRR